MYNLFKFGYEAAKEHNATTCLSDREDELQRKTLLEQHAEQCDDSSVDADGTCLVCGKTDLL